MTWSSLGLGAQGLGQFALLAVLARHLTAAEFGVMTATLIVVGAGRAVHAGVSPALVQRQELRPDHVRSAFALSWMVAIGLIGLMWVTAPLVGAFFHMEQLVPVMRAMSLLFAIQAPGLVPEALLQRGMQMRSLAQAEVAGVLIGWLPIGIGCAMLGCGVWSLVAAHLGQALVKSVALVWVRPHERAVWPVRGATRELVHYGTGFVAARLCNVAASQGDNFVVGRWMSAAALGVYGRAYQLMAMPAMFLGEVVDRIVFPLLSRCQDDRASLRLAYGRGVSLVATIMAPASALSIVLAPELVAVVLGPKWESVVLPFQVLMFGLVFRTGYKISDMLARATGTVYARAWRQAIFAALIFTGAWIGTEDGVDGVAIGIVAALGVNYLMMAQLSLRTTGMGWARFASLHVRGAVVGTAVAALTWPLAEGMRSLWHQPFAVLTSTLLVAGAVLAVALVRAPRSILGGDGMWLLSNLTGRASAGSA
ncbi:MAG: lipopolysaccharide biosynthesis protein [Planctomycetota bacterium]